MGIIKALSDAVGRQRRAKAMQVFQEKTGQICVNPLCSPYENVFSQARVLVDELKTVRPFGVGRNGARLPINKTPELAILDCPNEDMGWAEFADLMFLMWLTEKELNIHVWKDKRGNLTGYSILPVGCHYTNLANGEDYFQVSSLNGGTEILSHEDVMTLRYSRNPMNISEGVSPASAIEVQAQIADVMMQYQKAFIENGATPASITFVTANSWEEFEDKTHKIERDYHGAKNKNKTMFVWRKVLDDDTTTNEIEVKPIQGNNSTLAIKEIMTIVTDEINRAFGVSPFLMGDDSSAKYDNAELSDRQFTKRRVYPALVGFWSQFQHELNRCLPKGLPYGISFELEIPELTDRLRVKAETAGKNVENLRSLIEAGATPKAAVKALGIGAEWERVALDLYVEKGKAAEAAVVSRQNPDNPTPSNALPSGQNPDGTASMPSNTEDAAKPAAKAPEKHDCHCHACETTHDKAEYDPKFTKDEVMEQAIYKELTKLLESAINDALGDGLVLDEEGIEKTKTAIMDQLTKQADAGADEGAAEILGQVLGDTAAEIKDILDNGGYHVSEDFTERLNQRTERLISRLDEEAKEKARQTLSATQEKGLSMQEIRKELSTVMPKGRAATIARNELVYAFRAGKLENDKYIGQKYGLKLKKIWRCHHDRQTCGICDAMDGQEVSIDEVFPHEVEGKDKDGKPTVYSWTQDYWNEGGELTSAHVHCRCRFETVVVGVV